MWIVAVAWIYVVLLMALTEPTVVGAVMTFLGYCVLPLSILYYLANTKKRRERRMQARQKEDSSRSQTMVACRPVTPSRR